MIPAVIVMSIVVVDVVDVVDVVEAGRSVSESRCANISLTEAFAKGFAS